jgi:hypothetical protein
VTKTTKGRGGARPVAKHDEVPRKPLPKVSKAALEGPPVSLEEARTLARVRGARRGLGTAAAAPAESSGEHGPTPAKVGLERELLEKRRHKERERRKRDYIATMAVMKQRGARPFGGEVTAGPAAAFEPLQVFAEGDSWFDYPVPLFGGGIIRRLEKRLGVPILNLAEAGDEVRFMLGVEQRRRLIATLTEGCPAGGAWDALLFSGGGNDIVGNPMALWVRDWAKDIQPAQLIHQPRFEAALSLIRAGYEDLIALRDSLSPETLLVFHAYDFAIPDGRGVCHLGPWMKPAFDLRGFPNLDARFRVVRVMLEQFAAMLTVLEAHHEKVTFINGQGTLSQLESAWDNELHPERKGFDKFADMFQQRLKALFPNRVA